MNKDEDCKSGKICLIDEKVEMIDVNGKSRIDVDIYNIN